MARSRTSPSKARQRLLETADRLFYRHGVRAVGIDTVIAEAGVAKMTLYTHFPSKDDLIVAVLRYREEQVLAFFTQAIDRHARRTDRLRAFFAALREWFGSPDFRGCAFQNAALQLADPAHPGTEFVRGHKRRFTDLIRGFVEESVGLGAAKLVPAIALLVEGAVVTAVIQGRPDPATIARDAALKLVESAKGE
jgi:AcrR family transcriptional regulator